MTTDSNKYLNTQEAANYLRIRAQTLRKWRFTGRGPQYHRLGATNRARVVYSIKDLEDWLSERRFANTADEGQKQRASDQ